MTSMDAAEPPQRFEFLEYALDGTDSDLEHEWVRRFKDYEWTVNNSDLYDYSRRANIFGHPDSLSGLINAQIGHDDSNVGLDLAAGTEPRALSDLLNSGVLGLALATNYSDGRARTVNGGDLDRIDGDLLDVDTWLRIASWQQENAQQGFSLIMHRPIGGLQELSPTTYRGAAHFLLDMLQSGGLMFTQVPRRLVDESRELNGICRSIRAREDVSDVITSSERPPGTRLDEDDLYAVILKR